MRWKLLLAATAAFWMGVNPYAVAQPQAASSQRQTQMVADPVKILVDRLDLEQYKATVKGLTQFGDRRQGTDRNRAAIDWIEAQLRSYGCTNIARLAYNYQPPPSAAGPAAVVGRLHKPIMQQVARQAAYLAAWHGRRLLRRRRLRVADDREAFALPPA